MVLKSLYITRNRRDNRARCLALFVVEDKCQVVGIYAKYISNLNVTAVT